MLPKIVPVLLIFIFILAACAPATAVPASPTALASNATPTATETPIPTDEAGNTDGIVVLGSLLAFVILVGIYWKRGLRFAKQ